MLEPSREVLDAPIDLLDVFEQMLESVAVYDRDARILYVNATTERMFGRPRGALVGHVLWDLFPEAIGNLFYQAFQRVALTGETETFDHHYAPWDRWYKNRITTCRAGVCVIGSDITPERRAMDRLEEARTTLETTNAKLQTALQVARDADRRKDDFLAMLGHELRNPLAPILTAAELLRRKGVAAEREIAIIDRQGRHLVRLVDDLLEVSRITRGKLDLQRAPVELAAAVARAAETTAPLVQERGHTLTIDVPPSDLTVSADEARLVQILSNLLHNAAKYTPPGGHIDVVAERRGAHVALVVRDDGLGIAPDLLPLVFDPFVQGERSLDRQSGGLGLGLALVRSLVEMHGGRVTARSDGPGRGSTFEVVLPLLAGAASTAGRGASPATLAPSTTARILIVDDNEDAGEMLTQALRDLGHEVLFVAGPTAALAAVDVFPAEVAVLDIGLPGMDGYTLAGKIRDRLGHHVRLVAVTGYGQPSDRERSRAAGFDAHLVKPIELSALCDALTPPGGAPAA